MKKRDPLLSRMSAYHRLARKAEKAGHHLTAERYRRTAQQAHSEYLRGKQARDRHRA